MRDASKHIILIEEHGHAFIDFIHVIYNLPPFYSQGIATPALYLVDLERRSIYMEYVENATVLKDFIDKNISRKTDVDHLLDFIGRGLGTLIARLHSKHIIHGDLTTSNILLKNDSNEPPYNDQSKGN